MKEIISILKSYKIVKKEFYITVLILFLTESIFLYFPQISKELIHILEIKWSYHDLLFWFSVWIFFVVLASLFWVVASILQSKLRAVYLKNINQNYKKQLLEKNYSQIIDEWSWKLIARFNRWVQAQANIFLGIIEIMTNTVFKIIVISIIFVYFLPLFLFILIIFLILMYSLNSYIKRKIKKYVKAENEIYEKDSRLIIKIINEFLLIKIFWKTNQELNYSKQILKDLPKYRSNIRKHQVILYSSLFFFVKILEFSTYFFLWSLVLKWEMTIAMIVMIIWYLWTLWNPIETAIREINRITEDLEVYKKLKNFLNTPTEIKDGTKDFVFKKWEIKIRNLVFWYSKDKILFKNLNLEFLDWKKNALVGHSGNWKSTIIKILLRLYDYKSWEIFIDWQNLKDLKIESLYKYIWYLSQEPWIFDGTIRENLEYAFDGENIENKEEKIWEALEKAQIVDMIEKLEKWLDTEVGEKWVKLSWWEKQRLAIARIFLKDPKIIILDEPTSALDSISEHKITKALDELMEWRTSIVIAHRLQTVMHSDKIIVLENGKVWWEWKHNDLIKTNKIYKTLVDLQNGVVLE